MEDKSHFSKLCLKTIRAPAFCSSEVLAFCQRRKAPRSLFPTSIDAYLPPIQTNPCAKVAYFGVAHFDSLQPQFFLSVISKSKK